LLSEVQGYTASVLSESYTCPLAVCPYCGEAASFRRHDTRPRTFLVVAARLVHRVASFLVRFTCSLCRRRVSAYPPFALPHKRYVLPELLERTRRYLEADPVTYEEAASEAGLAIFHHRTDEAIDDRNLVRSTIHRWTTCFGNLATALARAHALVRQADPNSGLFRSAVGFPPRKYRSEDRRRLLGRALRLLEAAREFRRLFARDLFPDFATSGAAF
jgi:hypothetical protein